MAPPIARSLARAVGGVVVAAAILGLVELGLRVAGVPDPGLYAGDPASVWWLRPGLDRELPGPEAGARFHVRTNPLGLRGAMPPQEGAWTLALGCSTTFGWGVEGDQAWPVVLTGLVGEPVVNGGQPGWSTHQAVAAAGRWLDLGPSRVILAYIVRDAQLSVRPDHLARPTPWPWRSQLGRGLLVLLKQAGSAQRSGGEPRVPPQRFAANLRTLVDMAGPAEVFLLAFPQREPSEEHLTAMAELGLPVFMPQLAPEHFFRSDPIHLTPAGHSALAEQLAGAVH